MASVCFTGKGSIRHPMQSGFVQVEALSRQEWEARAGQLGWSIHKNVSVRTDYLVASRTNTVKAKDARDFGAKVISYEEFNDLWLEGQHREGWPSVPLSDLVEEKGSAPPPPSAEKHSPMRSLPEWGSW